MIQRDFRGVQEHRARKGLLPGAAPREVRGEEPSRYVGQTPPTMPGLPTDSVASCSWGTAMLRPARVGRWSTPLFASAASAARYVCFVHMQPRAGQQPPDTQPISTSPAVRSRRRGRPRASRAASRLRVRSSQCSSHYKAFARRTPPQITTRHVFPPTRTGGLVARVSVLRRASTALPRPHPPPPPPRSTTAGEAAGAPARQRCLSGSPSRR